jgi:hypothetical protein
LKNRVQELENVHSSAVIVGTVRPVGSVVYAGYWFRSASEQAAAYSDGYGSFRGHEGPGNEFFYDELGEKVYLRDRLVPEYMSL